MKEKIFIIGSNGTLGKHIVEKAIKSFGVKHLVFSDYKETPSPSPKTLYAMVGHTTTKR
jgi:nucleoside-diphosphate-sugar epimerase